jgi:hypothetical protein
MLVNCLLTFLPYGRIKSERINIMHVMSQIELAKTAWMISFAYPPEEYNFERARLGDEHRERIEDVAAGRVRRPLPTKWIGV